jgi:hypothetical protein
MKTKCLFLTVIAIMALYTLNLYSQIYRTTREALEKQGHVFLYNDKPDAVIWDAEFMNGLNVITLLDDCERKNINIAIHRTDGIPRFGVIFDNLNNMLDTILYFDGSINRQLVSMRFPYISNDTLVLVPEYGHPVSVTFTDVLTGEVVLGRFAELQAEAFTAYPVGNPNDPTIKQLYPDGTIKILNGDGYKINYSHLPKGVYFISFLNSENKIIYMKTLNKTK